MKIDLVMTGAAWAEARDGLARVSTYFDVSLWGVVERGGTKMVDMVDFVAQRRKRALFAAAVAARAVTMAAFGHVSTQVAKDLTDRSAFYVDLWNDDTREYITHVTESLHINRAAELLRACLTVQNDQSVPGANRLACNALGTAVVNAAWSVIDETCEACYERECLTCITRSDEREGTVPCERCAHPCGTCEEMRAKVAALPEETVKQAWLIMDLSHYLWRMCTDTSHPLRDTCCAHS